MFDLKVLEEGIPDDAYKPVTGDDKATAKYYRDRNRQEKRGQRGLDSLLEHPDIPGEIAAELRALAEQDERSPDDVRAKEELYAQMRARGTDWERLKIACDLWTYAFFAPMPPMNGVPSPLVPTTGVVRDQLRSGSARGDAIGTAVACSQAHPFFHWPLEFPDVFEAGGFDVVLGNPPWDRVKLQQQEFFSTRSRRIAEAPNAAARNRMVAALAESNDPADRALHAQYTEALRQAENSSVFLHNSGRFPLGGRGDVNLYAVFAELARAAVRDAGRAGVILPSGIATDDTTKVLFGSIAATGQLVELLDFENRLGIFPGIDSRMKFCLFTMRGAADSRAAPAEFAFFCTDVAHLAEEERRFTLSPEDFALFNPNTLTCPTFRSRRDAGIARKLYQRAGVFWREARDGEPEHNPWGVKFSAMFHMSNDSGLFRTRDELRAEGFQLHGNVFRHPNGREYLPLYEAKLFHQYDHRYATFDGVPDEQRSSGNARELTPAEKADPATVVIPRYWVPAEEVAARLDSGRMSGTERDRERERERERESRSSLASPLATGVSKDCAGDRRTVGDLRRDSGVWRQRLLHNHRGWLLAFRDIARATDERTAIFGVIEGTGVSNKAPLVEQCGEAWVSALRSIARATDERTTVGATLTTGGLGNSGILLQIDPVAAAAALLLASLDSIVLDWAARFSVGGVNMNFFIVRQLPVLPPGAFLEEALPGYTYAELIVPRVLELTYTAHDLAPFARDLGYEGPPFAWDEDRRHRLRCEIDAVFARMYGLDREELEWVLDARYPSESFRVLKQNEIARWGEYRTQRLVLEAYDRLAAGEDLEG